MKIIFTISKTIIHDATITANNCVNTLQSIHEILQLETKYYCEKGNHTQESWCMLIFPLNNENLNSLSMMNNYEKEEMNCNSLDNTKK